jgi:DNA primase
MENIILLNLLESVLGKSKPTSKGNHSFHCPFCNHHKPKLEINCQTNEKKENPWHCWVCNTKGKTIKTLFKNLKISGSKSEQLDSVIIPGKREDVIYNPIQLPEEFISFSNFPKLSKFQEIIIKQSLHFLKKRGITKEQIQKYNIGCCLEGEYSNRIIIPSYNIDGKLNYFIARSFENESGRKYKNPSVQNKDIIGLEYFINWGAPIILVEGIFDALTIQRNVIPLFGKVLSEALMKKLVLSDTEKVYVALDKDAQREALQHCQTLMSFGKEVYLVEMDGKDANEIGFKNFLNIIENTYPLTFEKIMSIKLKIMG